jgi:CRP/FNR family cyclic AMP-dependent transcriptional regulator
MAVQGSPASGSYNAGVAMEFFRFGGKPKSFARGERIFGENQKPIPFLLLRQRMYLLLDGEVGIQLHNKPIGTVRQGEVFGEMASINQGPRSATAVARTACRVIALDDQQLQAALGKKPEFALMLMGVMISRLRENMSRAGGASAGTVKSTQPAPLPKSLVADLARVLGSESRSSYESGQSIVREGQTGVLMYVVLYGRVAISVGGKKVERLGPGGVFGEIALIDHAPRLASVVAETACTLLAIDRHGFLNLVKKSRRFAAGLLAAVSERARYMTAR